MTTTTLPRSTRTADLALILAVVLFSTLLSGCLGDPPAYPYRPPEAVRAEARALSDDLEAYVRAWLDGAVPAAIPDHLLPDGYHREDNRAFRLVDPDTVDPRDLWATRPAAAIDPAAIYGSIPDPNATYLFLGTPYAPFGSRLVIDGEFPHCRFFNIQVSPPLDGETYYYNREVGAAEVAMVDADIDPLPGHVNPFRPGADRTAVNRRYRVAYDLAIGDPVAANPDGAHGQPYRSDEQRRTGALITAQGPWGADGSLGLGAAHGRGDLNLGAVWVRYYAMDHGVDPYGGVPLPRVWFELPGGERYLIVSDFSGFQERADQTAPAAQTAASHPPRGFGPERGWGKSFGIMHNILGGLSEHGVGGIDAAYGRDYNLGLEGRGEAAEGAGNFEAHATVCVNTTYIGRNMALGPEDPWRPGSGGKVAVLTGRMPVFPDTRDGAATMPTGDLRYWSIVGYDLDFGRALSTGLAMPAVNAVMDDEVVLDDERRYVICYSRPEDRPANATADNGVTWVDWGPTAELSLLLRWMSVGPEWITTPNPHDRPGQLGWSNASWSGTAYDPGLLPNGHDGHLGPHLPRISYMSRSDFEALGDEDLATGIPAWELPAGNGLLAPAEERSGTSWGLQLRTGELAPGDGLDRVGASVDPQPRVVGGVDAGARPRDDHYALRFDGYLNPWQTGTYRFALETAAAVRLRIDGRTVIEDDARGTLRQVTGDIGLAAGVHRISLEVAAGTGTDRLRLSWANAWQHHLARIPGYHFLYRPGMAMHDAVVANSN